MEMVGNGGALLNGLQQVSSVWDRMTRFDELLYIFDCYPKDRKNSRSGSG